MAMIRQLILTGCLKSPCLLRVYPSAWNNLVAYKANQESVWHATEPDSGGSSMEPPALARQGSGIRTASSSSWFMCAGHEGTVVDQVRADQIFLVPKVYRFFDAYLDADAVRRADFLKAVACVSHQFKFDPPVTPSVQEDRAAALEIAQRAAEISHANDVGEMADEVDPSFVDASLLADGYATLALGYRYIVGLYTTDSQMSKLGELAVRLVLLAEREYDPVLSAGDTLRRSLTNNATPSQELASGLSNFVPAAARQSDDVISSLNTISRRLKNEILLMA